MGFVALLYLGETQRSDHAVLHPFAAEEADGEEQGAEGPVHEHTGPDGQQAAAEMAHQQIAQGHPEQPHRGDADHHGVAGVAGGAQDVGQGEAGRPDRKSTRLNSSHD